jgi:hypothetical protein
MRNQSYKYRKSAKGFKVMFTDDQLRKNQHNIVLSWQIIKDHFLRAIEDSVRKNTTGQQNGNNLVYPINIIGIRTTDEGITLFMENNNNIRTVPMLKDAIKKDEATKS